MDWFGSGKILDICEGQLADGLIHQFSLTLLPGFIVGRLFDIGYFRAPLLISSLFLVVSTLVIGECKT